MNQIIERYSKELMDGGVPLKPVAGAGPHRQGHGAVTQAVKAAAELAMGQPFAYMEFGTWLGASALEASAAHPDCTVLCVDTWLGSREHWVTEAGPWGRHELALQDGIPHLYERFRDNVQQYSNAENILPLAMTTQTAFDIFRCHRRRWVPLKCILVDAAHDYDSVKHDLECAAHLLAQRGGGVLIGHDWPWEDVREAYHAVFGPEKPVVGGAYFSVILNASGEPAAAVR